VSRGKSDRLVLAVFLLAMAAVRVPGLLSRAVYHGEAITLLEASGHAFPSWPEEPTPAAVAKRQMEGASAAGRPTFAHPSVYYWCLSAWRAVFGYTLEAARALSLVFSLATLTVVYLLLRAAGVSNPFVPLLIYGVTMASVYFGHEARGYALSAFLISLAALFAWRACETERLNQRQRLRYAMGMAVCCGIAFSTHYFARFPAGVILAWYFFQTWRVSRMRAVFPLGLTALLVLAGALIVLPDFDMRSRQLVGFMGPMREAVSLLRLNMFTLFTPVYYPQFDGIPFFLVWMALLVYTLVDIWRSWQDINRRLMVLLLGLAAAPSVGLFLVDLLLDRHLHEIRYLTLAGPVLALLAGISLGRLLERRRWMALFLITGLVLIQLTGVNWNRERPPMFQGGSAMRSFARGLRQLPDGSYVVAIGAGSARGTPATVIHELDPTVPIVVFSEKSDLTGVAATLQGYPDVFLVASGERRTAAQEQTLADLLRGQGRTPQQWTEQPTQYHQYAARFSKARPSDGW